jgi:hypothetical protein
MANTVINDTNKTVYLKVGDEDAFPLEPGSMFTGDIDGVWQPERPNEVYKIGDFVDATVRPTGIDPFGPDVILEAGGYFGWQDQNFIDTAPGWKPFVSEAKTHHAKKQAPSGSSNGKLIEKPTPEDRMMITPDQVDFIITTLLEIKGQNAANTFLIETLQDKLGVKKCRKD